MSPCVSPGMPPRPPSRRRLETLVNGEATRRGLKMIVDSMGPEIACICEVPAGNDRPQAALEFAEAVIRQGAQEYPHIPLRCGIGRPAPGAQRLERILSPGRPGARDGPPVR